jgi:hypothetical protein
MLFATIPGVSAEAFGWISDRGDSADGISCLGNCCLGNSGGGIIQEQRTSKRTIDSIFFMRTSSAVQCPRNTSERVLTLLCSPDFGFVSLP